MKYLKLYESFSKIESICQKWGIENYTINADGYVDVDGDVYLAGEELTKLPLEFGMVTGDFACDGNELTSLVGSPKSVGGHFDCGHNQLTSLVGAPESVGSNFYCDKNQLISLEGAPEKIRGGFNCKNNKLTSLEHFPKVVVGDIYLYNNPVSDIWLLFYNKDYIELFNDYDIIHDDEIIIDRLNDFLQEIGKQPVESVEGYKNI